MYAVIKTGGKQYKVTQGDVLRVETLSAAEGETVTFDQVLLISDGGDVQLGSPIIDGKTVTANIVKHARGKKIEIIKFRRRKHYRKQMGHRQNYTEIEITAIDGKAGEKKAKPAPAAKKPAAEDKAAAPVAKKAATKKKVAAKKKTTVKKKTSTKSENK